MNRLGGLANIAVADQSSHRPFVGVATNCSRQTAPQAVAATAVAVACVRHKTVAAL